MPYPVILNCPAGHIENNFPLIMGGNAEIYKLNEAETGIRFTG
jgi:muramoyltetrapeptide carboxypeptidase LdcA involved in peptidoglycan recycling